jgi:hypothetical protein
MAIVRPEYIADLQRQQDLKFWRIYDSTGKTELNRLVQDIGLDASIDMLQKDLDNLSGDFVLVKLYANQPEKFKAGQTAETPLTRKVSLNGPYIGRPHHNGPHYNTGAPDWQFLLAMLDKQKSLELEMLEMKLKQEQSTTDKLLELVKQPQFITSVFGFLGNKKQTISQPPQIQAAPDQNLQSDETKLINTLERFSKLDPDYINTLHKMADKCENDPNILPMLKNTL